MIEFIKDIWGFLKARKKFWLLPIIVALVVVGGVLLAAQGSVIATFIYPFF